MPLLSVVIPVFNEAPNIQRAYETVLDVMQRELPQYDLEIIFTDNHSTDGSHEILRGLAESDSRVRVARFSRNFGYQQSIFAAYTLCRGDAAIQLDCDLQDPPALIPDFVERWRQGSHVVYGVRTKRQEGFLITMARKAFYRMVNALSHDELPVDAGDFRLVDRAVIDQLTQFWDYNPYLRGAIAWMGFEQTAVPYERDARTAGETKFNLRSLIALAVDGILAHSTVPLRVATFFGIVGAVVSLGGAGVYLVGRFVFGQSWPAGFATLAILMLMSISLTGLFFGIIGEYLGRMYLQSKGRPIVIIEAAYNLDSPRRSIRTGDPSGRQPREVGWDTLGSRTEPVAQRDAGSG